MPVILHWVHKRQSEKGGLWGPPFSLFRDIATTPQTAHSLTRWWRDDVNPRDGGLGFGAPGKLRKSNRSRPSDESCRALDLGAAWLRQVPCSG
jgi:hypothetical protein